MILVFTSLKDMEDSYIENLTYDGNHSLEMVQLWASQLHNFGGIYDGVYGDIYLNLERIYSRCNINFIPKLGEILVHESLHKILDEKIGIPINEKNIHNEDMHHLIIDKMGYTDGVLTDKEILELEWWTDCDCFKD